MREAELRARYADGLRSDDQTERAVSAEMLRRLGLAARRRLGAQDSERGVSAWGHIPFADLLAALGATGVVARDDRVQSGHDWAHGSRSGACLIAWARTGRWWCSSCRRGGDAVGLVRDALGLGHTAARAWLVARYGAPAGSDLPGRRARRRYNPAAHVVALGGSADA